MKIKPCPFCGRDPILYKHRLGWYIQCYSKRCGVAPSTSYFVTKKTVIEAWNTRSKKMFKFSLFELTFIDDGDKFELNIGCINDDASLFYFSFYEPDKKIEIDLFWLSCLFNKKEK